LYSNTLIYTAVGVIIVIFALLTCLAYINPRKSSVMRKLFSFIITNVVNLTLRPFSVIILAVLFNKPLIMLYKNENINSAYFSEQIIVTIVSVIFLVIFCVLNSLYIKYINNPYFFEKFP